MKFDLQRSKAVAALRLHQKQRIHDNLLPQTGFAIAPQQELAKEVGYFEDTLQKDHVRKNGVLFHKNTRLKVNRMVADLRRNPLEKIIDIAVVQKPLLVEEKMSLAVATKKRGLAMAILKDYLPVKKKGNDPRELLRLQIDLIAFSKAKQ